MAKVWFELCPFCRTHDDQPHKPFCVAELDRNSDEYKSFFAGWELAQQGGIPPTQASTEHAENYFITGYFRARKYEEAKKSEHSSNSRR